MDTEKKTTNPAADNPAEDPEGFVRFSKLYHFEGQDYAGIDLSNMEDLTARDMIAAEKYLSKCGIISPLPDQTAEYACFMAGRITGLPLEFFKDLPPKEFNRVKNKLTVFFYGED